MEILKYIELNTREMLPIRSCGRYLRTGSQGTENSNCTYQKRKKTEKPEVNLTSQDPKNNKLNSKKIGRKQ